MSGSRTVLASSGPSWPRLALALSGWAALAASRLPEGAGLRVAVTALFLCLCPGLAAVRWVRPVPLRAGGRTAVLEAGVLTVTLSMSLAAVVVGGLFLGGAFTATRGLLVLAALTSVLALVPRRR